MTGSMDNDNSVVAQALERHRADLRRIVQARLDPRLLGRLDGSDVVQDVMLDAAPKVESWQAEGKSVFACLYQLARIHIGRVHRDHLARQKRAVGREQIELNITDQSVFGLAKRLAVGSPTPSQHAIKNELCQRVRAALEQLQEADREVLLMRIVEGISAKAAGEVLGISEAAVNMRQLRALQRLRPVLQNEDSLFENQDNE